MLQGQLPGREGPARFPLWSRHQRHTELFPLPGSPTLPPSPPVPIARWPSQLLRARAAHHVGIIAWHLPSTHRCPLLFQQTSLTRHKFKEKRRFSRGQQLSMDPGGPLCDSRGCTPVTLALVIITANTDRAHPTPSPGLWTHSILFRSKIRSSLLRAIRGICVSPQGIPVGRHSQMFSPGFLLPAQTEDRVQAWNSHLPSHTS